MKNNNEKDMCIFRLQGITKIYNKGKENAVTALDDINLEIEEGELLAIVGESGSGKSTLLHLLGGLDQPTSGEVLYNGKRMKYKSPDWLASYRNCEVGFVLQDFGLLMADTALENVCVPLLFAKSGGLHAAKKAAKQALELAGIGDLAKRKAGELSGGQKQRVAIARALVNNPNVILADEPTGALDSKTSSEIVSLLMELNRKGKTVIIVTHDLSIADKCRRVVKLADGIIM